MAEAFAQYVEIAGMPVVATQAARGTPGAAGAAGTAAMVVGNGFANGGGNGGSSASAGGAAAAGQAATPGSAQAVLALRKGLSVAEVEALLGPAARANAVREGALTLMKRTCKADGRQVATSFVEGVLFDFAITPR